MSSAAEDQNRPQTLDQLTTDHGRDRGASHVAVSILEVREALAAPGWRGFALLRRHQRERPDQRRALARQLRGVPWESREDFESRRVRFGFVGSASTANLEDAVLLESLSRGIVPLQYHAASPQTSRELRDPGSGLHLHRPDAVIVATSPGAPSADLELPSAARAEGVEAFLDALLGDLRAFRAQSSAVLLVHGFVPPEFRPMALCDWHEADGQARTYARLNTGLAERLRDVPDARLVDVSHLVALAGASWWTLHRSWFLANVAIPDEAASLLARDYAAAGAALRGLARKCLVLDLDGTLWGGVVGEVGADRIQLGNTYPGNIFRAIQQVARHLHERGVLLVLNSHNNEGDAWEPFRRRPEMVLERRHFAAWRINWQDKATNLQELADELHLGLDSFVMLDNDPVQQAWIEERLPQVHVISAQDPLDMLHALATQRLFETFGHTAEDGLRPRSYEVAVRRREAETSAGDRDAFLSRLDLIVTVGRASTDKLPRLAQMAQRTNQFNMTTQRYTEGQIGELCASSDVEVLWCSCRDRFADEGITGLAILRGPGEEWLVDTFLLSCRVLGRGVERALAAAVCRVAFARGARRLLGEYRRTLRNAPAAEFYREVGFSAVRSDGERSVWRLTLPEPADLAPRWITLRFEGHEA